MSADLQDRNLGLIGRATGQAAKLRKFRAAADGLDVVVANANRATAETSSSVRYVAPARASWRVEAGTSETPSPAATRTITETSCGAAGPRMGSNPTLRADSMTVSTRGLALTGHLRIRSGLLADPVLRCLFAIGFLLTSVYVATFNYTTFRLKAAPYSFGQAALSAIFLVTIFGITASTLAGVAVDRVGRFRPLLLGLALMMTGIAMTLETGIVQIIAGVATINAGFFIAHSVVSGWVERESKSAKGHAASQYLLFYYLGSSISGVAGGWFWRLWGWPGVGGMMTAATVLAVLLTGPPLAANLESDVDSDLSAIETTTLRAWPPFGAFDAPALLGRTARSRTPLHVDARAPLRAVAPLNLLPEYASGEDRGGLRPVSGRHQVLAGVGSGRFFRCTLSRRNVPQAAPQQ